MGRKAGIAARRKPCARCGRFALPEGGRSRRQHTTLKIVRYDPRLRALELVARAAGKELRLLNFPPRTLPGGS